MKKLLMLLAVMMVCAGSVQAGRDAVNYRKVTVTATAVPGVWAQLSGSTLICNYIKIRPQNGYTDMRVSYDGVTPTAYITWPASYGWYEDSIIPSSTHGVWVYVSATATVEYFSKQ
jgi:hypothetical protein